MDPSLSFKHPGLAAAENNKPGPAFFFQAGMRSSSIVQIKVTTDTRT